MTDQIQPAPTADPSMEDILASIRRILSEDEAAAPAAAAPQGAGPAAEEDVLQLDDTMLRSEPPVPPGATAVPVSAPPSAPAALPSPAADPMPAPIAAPPQPAPEVSGGLVGAAAEAAAASSVASLLRTIASDRALQVRSTGPTIEDLVRQGLRPLLKEWLDANLPALVERLVRTEIERVVGRAMH